MSENKPKISIIIPAYNAEKTLRRCIDSVLTQSYKNFEVIIVNDGSKDSTGNICDEYRNIDNRISVIHQENKGVSTARNVGINNSTGTWITFLDADDFIEKETFSDITAAINQFPQNDIYQQQDLNLSQYEFFKTANKPSFINYDINDVEFIKRFKGQVFNYIFRLKLIKENRIKFPIDIKYAEDVYFIFEYLKFCKTITVISNQNYIYNDLNISATSHISQNNNFDHLKVAHLIEASEVTFNRLKESLVYSLRTRYLTLLTKEKHLSLIQKIRLIKTEYKVNKILQKQFTFLGLKKRIIVGHPIIYFLIKILKQ